MSHKSFLILGLIILLGLSAYSLSTSNMGNVVINGTFTVNNISTFNGNLIFTQKNITNVTNLIGGIDNIVIGDAGVDSHSLTSNDDLFISGKLEVDGLSYFDANSNQLDDVQSQFGSGSDAAIEYDTAQTNDAWMFGTSVDSNSIHICELADMSYNHATLAESDPAVYIWDRNQSTVNYGKLQHDTIDFTIDSGTNIQTYGLGNITNHQNTILESDVTIGYTTNYDLITITINGTNVLIISNQNLPITFGNSTNTWGEFLANGTFSFKYGHCDGC